MGCPLKEFLDSVNYSACANTINIIKINVNVCNNIGICFLRFTLEILHYFQKVVVVLNVVREMIPYLSDEIQRILEFLRILPVNGWCRIVIIAVAAIPAIRKVSLLVKIDSASACISTAIMVNGMLLCLQCYLIIATFAPQLLLLLRCLLRLRRKGSVMIDYGRLSQLRFDIYHISCNTS